MNKVYVTIQKKLSFDSSLCGRRWIRTTEGKNQQIYSLPHLATLVFAPFASAKISIKVSIMQLYSALFLQYFQLFCRLVRNMLLYSALYCFLLCVAE